MEANLLHSDLTRTILGCAIEVHRQLGPGLIESAYRICLCRELAAAKLPYQLEVPIPVRYKGETLDTAYRADVIVAENILLELKAVQELLPVHEAQLLTYLRLSQMRVGFLINFNVRLLREGIRRLVH